MYTNVGMFTNKYCIQQDPIFWCNQSFKEAYRKRNQLCNQLIEAVIFKH